MFGMIDPVPSAANVAASWIRAVAVVAGIFLAVGCDSGSDGDPGEGGGTPLSDSSGTDSSGTDTSGTDTGGTDTGGTDTGGTDTGGTDTGGTDTGGTDTGGTDTGADIGEEDGGGGSPTTADVIAALDNCVGCHGGGGCTTGICFLDNTAVLKSAPKTGFCNKGETTTAECAANLMESQAMPTGCSFQNNCSSAADVALVREWIDAGFPE